MSTVWKGTLLIILSQLFFALMDSCVKAISHELSVASILFFRNIISVLVLLPFFIASGQVSASFGRLPYHLMRSCSGIFGMYLLFLSISLLPLSEVSMLRAVTPLFVPLIAFIWLKEKLQWILLPCFLLSLTGTILLSGIDKPHFSLMSFIPLAAGLFMGIAMVALKRMTMLAKGTEIVFYFSLTGILLSIILGVFTQFPLPNSVYGWLLAFLVGALGLIGQLTLTAANKYANASMLAPFYYLNPLFGALIAHWYWNETLGLWGWTGGLLIISAGLLLTHFQIKRKKA